MPSCERIRLHFASMRSPQIYNKSKLSLFCIAFKGTSKPRCSNQCCGIVLPAQSQFVCAQCDSGVTLFLIFILGQAICMMYLCQQSGVTIQTKPVICGDSVKCDLSYPAPPCPPPLPTHPFFFPSILVFASRHFFFFFESTIM